jgi:hypothetical protein
MNYKELSIRLLSAREIERIEQNTQLMSLSISKLVEEGVAISKVVDGLQKLTKIQDDAALELCESIAIKRLNFVLENVSLIRSICKHDVLEATKCHDGSTIYFCKICKKFIRKEF